jgi:hypothetical protein
MNPKEILHFALSAAALLFGIAEAKEPLPADSRDDLSNAVIVVEPSDVSFIQSGNCEVDNSRASCITDKVEVETLGASTELMGTGASQSGDWVYLNEDGVLVYRKDASGNRIPDFSRVGYRGGEAPIPTIGVAVVVEPIEVDASMLIQSAIDQVSKLPMDANGFRGAVLLRKGRYEVGQNIRIRHSGIVLRGEGQDEQSGTVLVATGNQKRNVIQISGESGPRIIKESGQPVTDDYVPVGSHSLTVRDASAFSVGDAIIVRRPGTSEWIAEIGMDQIPPRPDGGVIYQWKEGRFDLDFDRVISEIDGNTLTLDAPLTASLDQQYGGGVVFAYENSGRIRNVGVENLMALAAFSGERSDRNENHAWIFIVLSAVENAWIRDVTSRNFGFGLVSVLRSAKWVTIRDSSCLDPVSKVAGGRRYSFFLKGQLNLVENCFSRNARHDFVIDSVVPGPNVFFNCYSENSLNDSGPHHRWATGALYDNVRISGNAIRVMNRLRLGSGHGWAGANSVVWNCQADYFVVQSPPTALNWAIGNVGEVQEGDFWGKQGEYVSHGIPVTPRSLYQQQLSERVGSAFLDE